MLSIIIRYIIIYLIIMYEELLEYIWVGIITMIVYALTINIILDGTKRKEYNTPTIYIILLL